jgi:membrane protein
MPAKEPTATPKPRWVAIKDTLVGFWSKLNEDWVFNLSGMLAYNFLTATAPLALVALAVAGLALGSLSPETYNTYVQGLSSGLPSGGQQLVAGALKTLSSSAGILLVIAVATALFAGSRLFVALENCFCVIYRLRNRSFIPQNLVAIGMTILYGLLAPVAFIASSEFSSLVRLITPAGSQPPGNVLSYLGGLAAGILAAFILFYAMYLFVPSRGQSWRGGWRIAWRGALVASILLTLYQQLFPLYQSTFMKNAGYGSAVGLAIVAIVFLYYIGFISLLGAEVNTWAEGMRPLSVGLPDLFYQRGQEEERRGSQEAAQGHRAAQQEAGRPKAIPPGAPA